MNNNPYCEQAIKNAFKEFFYYIDRTIPGMEMYQMPNEGEEGADIVADVEYKEVER